MRLGTYVKKKFTNSQINRAGNILVAPDNYSADEQKWANTVLANWRACHGYPINTFQATLRQKLKTIDADALVAQRMKRAPSIVLKLQRFEGMNMARMQDIGGLRAIVGSMKKLRNLEVAYRDANFKHILSSSKDYVKYPKDDGYRSIHLIYKYENPLAPEYNGLSLELQLRTKLQHAWATAVETMGTFLGQALKSGQGTTDWKAFFSVAGAALAIVEKTPPVAGFEGKTDNEVFSELAKVEKKLKVLEKLQGFAIAADQIKQEKGRGAYHLLILNFANRSVTIKPFPISRLEQANIEYAEIEQRQKSGEQIEAVLISAGPVEAMKKAYPNYFLDTDQFVRQIMKLIAPYQVSGN